MLTFMFLEKLGYILSEAPVLILMVWSAVWIVRWRRSRDNRPWFNQQDQRLLFHAAEYRPNTWAFYPRFILAVLAVAILGFLQLVILAPLGAAIGTGAFILTSAVIVHGVLLRR
jgi:hypothetical protein